MTSASRRTSRPAPIRSASVVQPSAGANRSVVIRPVTPPWFAIAWSASMIAPRSGCVPPIITHHAARKSDVAAGTPSRSM